MQLMKRFNFMLISHDFQLSSAFFSCINVEAQQQGNLKINELKIMFKNYMS